MTEPTIARRPHARRSIVALVAFLLAAGGLTACSSAVAKGSPTAATARQATASTAPADKPPTVHMVTNQGHRLAFYVTAGRLPAIVLDAGGGLDASYWNKIVPVLAKDTGSEIITYDRSGEGRSSDVPGPWRAQNAASDLAAGLTQLGATHDVVLVSHSLAGEIATYFANEHPHWITGAVLVDASLPEFYTPSESARIVTANQQQIAALKAQPQTRATRQLLAEAADYGPVHLAYHQMTWPRSVPAIVIVSSQTPFPTPVDAALWRQAQRAFASAAPNRHLITAEHSSHDIPLDRPDMVIDAVQHMLDQVR